MNVVVKIKGREALAVWTLPYVTSWRLSPDMLLQRLADDEMYVSEKFPIAFTLASDKTPNPIPPAQWYELSHLIEKLEQDLTNNNLSRVKDRKTWKKETIEAFWEDEPNYVWLDDFLQWYEESFINNYWISEKNENTELCFNPKLPKIHAEFFEKHEIRKINQGDVDYKDISLDAVNMDEQINQGNKKGWPTMTLESFVETVLVSHVGERNSIPVFLKLLDEYELVIQSGVVNAQPIDTTSLINRIKKEKNEVITDLWETLLIKERHYSIHRGDVAEAYKRADKVEFPWLQIDEKLSCLPCVDFIEMSNNDASKLFGLPAEELDFKDALKQDSWTAREAICWLHGRNPAWCRGNIEDYFRQEVELVRKAIKAKNTQITNDESSPIEWILWANSKDWKLPDAISEFTLNGEQIEWKYWATMPSFKSSEASMLSLCIDPIKYSDGDCFLGQLTDEIKLELRKCERWLESHSESWTLPQLIKTLGDNRSPNGMKDAAIEWKPNKQFSEVQKEITKKNIYSPPPQAEITTSNRPNPELHSRELKQGLREIWINENKPEARFFFPTTLKKYINKPGSPITEVLTAGKFAGISYETSSGTTGKITKKTISNYVSEFKKYCQ